MSESPLRSTPDREEPENRLSGRSGQIAAQILAWTVATLILLGGGSLLLVFLFSFVLGYGTGGMWLLVPPSADLTLFVLITILLIALCVAIVGSLVVLTMRRRSEAKMEDAQRGSATERIRQATRESIRRRLTVSHIVTVTASTFVYATGGFLLLVALLIYSRGYEPRQITELFPSFAVATIFVLVQIFLITFCGLIVAALASRRLSRPIIAQITELEGATDAIAGGHLDRRVRVMTNDELGRLAGRFNLLAERLETLDGDRRAFVANISHDLRTPITIIRSHLDAQLDGDRADGIEPQTSFATIDRETRTLTTLIDDLFTLSRLEEAALPMATGAVDLSTLATNAVESIRPYALKTARVAVHATVPQDLARVSADPTRLLQVINNLLHNAIRHTPEGGVVMLSAEEVEGARAIEVVVRDTGVGIAADDIPRIFDRFYQGESTREGGTGLGLSIVKQLVEIQGGSVHAESTLGEGTAIMFRLPVVGPGSR